MGYVCPQWPDRCCFCFTKRLGVIATGLAFCVLDFLVIFLCGYTLFFDSNMWDKGKPGLFFIFLFLECVVCTRHSQLCFENYCSSDREMYLVLLEVPIRYVQCTYLIGTSSTLYI